MKSKLYFLLSFVTVVTLLSACKKTADYKDLSKAVVLVAAPISDAGCLIPTGTATSLAVKGTMLAGKTYNVCGNLIVNEGDTLTVQEGVTVNFKGNYGIGVKGSMVVLGTQAKPVYFTSPDVVKTDQIGANLLQIQLLLVNGPALSVALTAKC